MDPFPFTSPVRMRTTAPVVRTIKPALVALVLALGPSVSQAEIGSNESAGEFHTTIGIIHGLGEVVGTGLAADGEGFLVSVGYNYTDDLSLNGRYEVADFDIYQNFRLTLDRKFDLTDDLSLHLLGGYTWQNLLARSVQTDAILTNAGLCWERGSWFFGANYSRVFALDTSTNFRDRGLSTDLPEKHSDLFEVIAGYRMSENCSVILSYERQFGGDTQIQMKKHVVLGVRLKL